MTVMQLLAGTIAVFAASTAVAQGGAVYVGGSLGQATFREFCVDAPTVLACDDKGMAWKLFGGYRFNPFFAVEASYVDFGEIEGTLSTGSGRRVIPLSQSGLGLAVVGSYGFTPRFSVFGKAGFLMTEQETPASASGNTQREETELHYGIGARFAFAPAWSARAEWERTEKTKVDLWSIGVEFRF
jgi:OmpA-OmpF porin, OOP family